MRYKAAAAAQFKIRKNDKLDAQKRALKWQKGVPLMAEEFASGAEPKLPCVEP